jgi:GNAT superfamily N-acetyltransferase
MKLWQSRVDKIAVDVTYMQMFDAPVYDAPCAPDSVQVLRADQPPAAFYRFLYGTVGKQWRWYERLKLTDNELNCILHTPHVEVHVLYVGGVPAGYVEMVREASNETEIAYFGLMPDFIGQGLGRFFLEWSLTYAWSRRPVRVWLHTCSLDHPRALPNYQRAGLVSYRRERVFIIDPRSQYPDLGSGIG